MKQEDEEETESAKDALALYLKLQDPAEAARFARIFDSDPAPLDDGEDNFDPSDTHLAAERGYQGDV